MLIKMLQLERKKYPKGSIENNLKKDIGNALYGLLVRGMSNKMRFDIKSGKTVRMEANDLSNPILAS